MNDAAHFSQKLLPVALSFALTTPAWAIQYRYDALNRLVEAKYASGKTILYEYDAAGNMLTVQTSPQEASVVDIALWVKNRENEIISNATLTLSAEVEPVPNGDGSYLIRQIPEGDYTAYIHQGNYTYAPVVFTVDANTATSPIELVVSEPLRDEDDGITAQNLVIVGAYACDANYVSILEPSNGAIFHDFKPDLDARGIYLEGVDFDQDGLTDIAVGGIGKGSEMVIYDTQRKAIGRIKTNGDDKGVLVSFGDLDGNDSGLFEILVTNQSKDTQVNMYQSNGKAIRPLSVLDKKKEIRIATGDTDGDGVDELIVVLAKKGDKDQASVLRFDQMGTLLGSFYAQPNDQKTSGLVVTVADVDGDGKEEIVVAEAEKSNRYGVAVYGGDGALQTRFNAFSGKAENVTRRDGKGDDDGQGEATNENVERKVAVCHNGETIHIDQNALKAHLGHGDTEGACGVDGDDGKDGDIQTHQVEVCHDGETLSIDQDSLADHLVHGDTQGACPVISQSDEEDDGFQFAKCKSSKYKGDGLLLASGDVNGDGKADIIVSRAGYRTVKLFDGEGGLINWFTGADEGYQITALSYGESMGLELPAEDAEVLPPVLENVTVTSKPGQKRREIRGQKIRGSVRMANVLIFEVEIEVGARLILDLGVRFFNRIGIPSGLDLSGTCHKKKPKHRKVKRGKRKYQKYVQAKDEMDNIEVLDLSTPVVDNAPSVLDDIKVLVGDTTSTRRMGFRRDGGAIQVTQDLVNGNVELRQGDTVIAVTPVGMEQAAVDAPAGITIDPDGMVHVTTAQGQRVHFHAAVQDMDAFVSGLDENGNLQSLEVDDDGQMRAYYQNLPNAYHVGRADFTSNVLADPSIPDGVHSASTIYPSLGDVGVVLVFTEDDVKRWQWIWPAPADREALAVLAENDNSLGAVTLHYDDAGNPAGTIGFTLNGQAHLATLDYLVRTGDPTGATEISQTETGEYEIVYPNGDRQGLILLQ